MVLKPQPLRVYQGHKQDVLDIAWSRSQFLLSASMDKSVRLWHISMDDCLRVFRCVLAKGEKGRVGVVGTCRHACVRGRGLE